MKYGITGVLVALFAIAILPMPMGYYYLLRLVVAFCSVIAFHSNEAFLTERQEKLLGFLIINHIIIVILFNPLIIISFDKGIWVLIDIWAIIIYGTYSYNISR